MTQSNVFCFSCGFCNDKLPFRFPRHHSLWKQQKTPSCRFLSKFASHSVQVAISDSIGIETSLPLKEVYIGSCPPNAVEDLLFTNPQVKYWLHHGQWQVRSWESKIWARKDDDIHEASNGLAVCLAAKLLSLRQKYIELCFYSYWNWLALLHSKFTQNLFSVWVLTKFKHLICLIYKNLVFLTNLCFLTIFHFEGIAKLFF